MRRNTRRTLSDPNASEFMQTARGPGMTACEVFWRIKVTTFTKAKSGSDESELIIGYDAMHQKL